MFGEQVRDLFKFIGVIASGRITTVLIFLRKPVDFHGLNERSDEVVLVLGLLHAFFVKFPDVRAEDLAEFRDDGLD
jgi:hypothetical protein